MEKNEQIKYYFLENNTEYEDVNLHNLLETASKTLQESKRSREILVYFKKINGKTIGRSNKIIARVLRTGTYAIYDKDLWTSKG